VIPEITGASGTISKSLRQYVSNIPGEHEIKQQQKTAILGTGHYTHIKESKSCPVTGLEWPRGFQEVKVPRFHDNGTGRW
jgi:hypothetical protein